MKNLKVIVASLFFITAQIYAADVCTTNENLEENLRAAIRENNPDKVEKYLEDDVNINFIYQDTKKTPMYEALQNLEKQTNRTFLGKIIGPIFSGGLIIGGVFARGLIKNSIYNSTQFIDYYKNFDKHEKELRIHAKDMIKSNFEDAIKVLKTEIAKKKAAGLPTEGLEYELDHDEKIVKDLKDKENNPKKYINKYLRENGLKAVGGFLSIIGLIIGTIGVIYKGKQLYDSLTNAQRIALMIQNHPEFKLDLSSAEFIKSKTPKFGKFLENK